MEAATDKLRPEKVEKRPVRLGIRVEKVEFHQHTNRLRIAGVIESGGVDVSAHHTLNVEAGFEISVVKRWRAVDCERIRRAVDASAYGVVHVVSVEEGGGAGLPPAPVRPGMGDDRHGREQQGCRDRHPVDALREDA
ncbi:hypothetical protein [Methanoculleus chikugoensis]|uniref:hypothetical protein n=1 Tax=Methanoculleus chikugoensis TaxID=118126 RepID=UPI000A3FC81D|nr:hypothetical protein [Methanoculleus chikugoensis]